MIEYFKQYFKWSNENYSDESARFGYDIPKTGRLRVIIIHYLILFFSWIIFLFPPFPFLAKMILFITFELFSIFTIFLADFRIIKIIRLYILSFKKEKSPYIKFIYDNYFDINIKNIRSGFNKRNIYIKGIINATSYSTKYIIMYKNVLYIIKAKTKSIIIRNKENKNKVIINNKYNNMEELYDAIQYKLMNFNV